MMKFPVMALASGPQFVFRTWFFFAFETIIVLSCKGPSGLFGTGLIFSQGGRDIGPDQVMQLCDPIYIQFTVHSLS